MGADREVHSRWALTGPAGLVRRADQPPEARPSRAPVVGPLLGASAAPNASPQIDAAVPGALTVERHPCGKRGSFG